MKSPSTSATPTHQAGLQRLMLMLNEHLSELSEYVRHALAAAEDVVQGPAAALYGEGPDEEQRELRRCVDLALAELLTSARVALVLHLAEAEVNGTEVHALAFLRQRLIESGCRF